MASSGRNMTHSDQPSVCRWRQTLTRLLTQEEIGRVLGVDDWTVGRWLKDVPQLRNDLDTRRLNPESEGPGRWGWTARL